MPLLSLAPGLKPGGNPIAGVPGPVPGVPLVQASRINMSPSPGQNLYPVLNIYPRGGTDYSQFFSDICPNCGKIHHLWSRDPSFTCFANGQPGVPFFTNIVPSDLPSGDINWLIWANSMFLGVGRNTIVYAEDGQTWKRDAAPPLKGNWQTITGNASVGASGATAWVMAGYDDFGNGIIAYSTDPRTGWVYIVPPANTGPLVYSYWDGTNFILLGKNTLLSSTDGKTWTAQTIPAGKWTCIAYNGSNLYVAIDLAGQTMKGATLAAMALSTATIAGIVDIVYGPSSTFVAVGANSGCVTTTDGVTFTAQTIAAGTYTALIYDGTNLVAVGIGVIATSTNGTAWSAQTPPSASAFYDDVQNVGTNQYATAGFGAVAAYSTNRTAWAAETMKVGYDVLRAGLVVET